MILGIRGHGGCSRPELGNLFFEYSRQPGDLGLHRMVKHGPDWAVEAGWEYSFDSRSETQQGGSRRREEGPSRRCKAAGGHLSFTAACARERQGPAAPSLPAIRRASDVGWLKVLRARPLAQARFLRAKSNGGRGRGRAGAWKAWVRPQHRGSGSGQGGGTGQKGPCHVAHEMAALCSLAFMRRAAMLDVLRSGSPFSS